jgi:ribosomal protein S18 acetylase RimI-like enzyme
MIQKLNNNSHEIAKKIRVVFQASYKIEAKLLGAKNFPPLKRLLKNYMESQNDFYGYLQNHELAAVIEIEHTKTHTRIKSLVVAPYFFRQGMASKLVQFTFDSYNSPLFIVETGAANLPATTLYTKFGFVEVLQWNTDFGIRKVKFKKTTV